jgi:hypothetical protein
VNLQKKDLDVSKVFLTFLAMQGDVTRTAFACNLEPKTVEELAVTEQWAVKIQQFVALREADQHVQINVNRALNYVQARQLSTLVDAVIQKFSNPDELMDALTTVTKNGSTFSTKPLTDLVRAAEMIQNMTARALGDVGANIEGDKTSGGSVGLSVARALNAVAANVGVDAVTVVKKSLELPDADSGRNQGTAPAASA